MTGGMIRVAIIAVRSPSRAGKRPLAKVNDAGIDTARVMMEARAMYSVVLRKRRTMSNR